MFPLRLKRLALRTDGVGVNQHGSLTPFRPPTMTRPFRQRRFEPGGLSPATPRKTSRSYARMRSGTHVAAQQMLSLRARPLATLWTSFLLKCCRHPSCESADAFPRGRHDVAAPDSQDQQHDACRRAKHQCDDRGLKPETPARQNIRPLDIGTDQARIGDPA